MSHFKKVYKHASKQEGPVYTREGFITKTNHYRVIEITSLPWYLVHDSIFQNYKHFFNTIATEEQAFKKKIKS